MMLFNELGSPDSYQEIEVAGYSVNPCGYVFRESVSKAVCGMPLGGIDTGCVDLETSGLWGYSTIFNSLIPRGGPWNTPMLGVSDGRNSVVLSSLRAKVNWISGGITAGEEYEDQTNGETLYGELPDGLTKPKEIRYFGHYPVADIQYDLDIPLEVSCRAFTPFIPGDVQTSTKPCMLLAVTVKNTAEVPRDCVLAFDFLGASGDECGGAVKRSIIDEPDMHGVLVRSPCANYVVASSCRNIQSGAALGSDLNTWAAIGRDLPDASACSRGVALSANLHLNPGEESEVRFVVSWLSPTWNGSGNPLDEEINGMAVWKHKLPPGETHSRSFTHMYAKYHPDATETARSALKYFDVLLQRIISWQEAIYAYDAPMWLRDGLVNVFHMITEDSVWAQKTTYVDEAIKEEDGIFTLSESPRDCPQLDCTPCTWYGGYPVTIFFPELSLSNLRAYKAYQEEDGCIPFTFGGCTNQTPPYDPTQPTRGYQVVENVSSYVDMVYRHYLLHKSDEFLKEFYHSVKQATIFMVNLNRGEDGIISMPDRRVSVNGMPYETEAFEHCEWYGMAARIGGRHIAQLLTAKVMAERYGDDAFASECDEWIKKGQTSMETKMWNNGYYLNFYEEATGKRMDAIFAYQLDGQWVADLDGLPTVFRPERVRETLETIEKNNVAATEYGCYNFKNSDGQDMQPGQSFLHAGYQPYDFFTPEALMLAMTYMYNGFYEMGMGIAERCWSNVCVKQGMMYDIPNIVNGITGKTKFGNDYYQNMVLWAMPAALKLQPLDSMTNDGGIAQRVVKAGE